MYAGSQNPTNKLFNKPLVRLIRQYQVALLQLKDIANVVNRRLEMLYLHRKLVEL